MIQLNRYRYHRVKYFERFSVTWIARRCRHCNSRQLWLTHSPRQHNRNSGAMIPDVKRHGEDMSLVFDQISADVQRKRLEEACRHRPYPNKNVSSLLEERRYHAKYSMRPALFSAIFAFVFEQTLDKVMADTFRGLVS